MRMCELVMRFEAVTPGKIVMTVVESAVFDRSPTGSIGLFLRSPWAEAGLYAGASFRRLLRNLVLILGFHGYVAFQHVSLDLPKSWRYLEEKGEAIVRDT